MTAFRLAPIAAFLAAPTAAAAQQPAAGAPVASAWQVDWGEHYCSLIRKPEADRPFATAFVTVPGSRYIRIRLATPEGATEPTGVNNVVLQPAGTVLPVTTDQFLNSRVPGRLNLYRLPQDFREQLANATELQLRTGDRIRARVPLDGVRAGLAGQRRCLSDVAREWGLDEAALTALQRRPETTNMLGLEPTDIPAAALRRADRGLTTVRITVSAEGRPLDCVTVATSGSPEMDATVCRIALARGRFTPALDANGRPVTARTVFMNAFYLANDPPGGR
jgi:TonB family protein